MKINKEGLEIIKSFEGLSLKAYRCPAGVLTIGYGHTGADVKENSIITEKYALKLLRKDIKGAEKEVRKYKRAYYKSMTRNQFSALVSFTFNCGSGNLKLLTDNGRRDLGTIATKMLLYNKANGKTLDGLVRRRQAEYNLFVS